MGHLKTLFNGEKLYQTWDDAKDACAVGCLATSGCAYAELYFRGAARCDLKTDACGDYASTYYARYFSLFVVSPPPSPPHPPPSDSACEVNR